MKKRILITTTLLCSILVFSSCNQNSTKKEAGESNSVEEVKNNQDISSGEKWLKSIFECTDGNEFCFPDEEKVFTERYYEFFVESLGIFEFPDFETEDERIAAEASYKNKWKDIYPMGKEVWAPFGRGNGIGTGDKLENVIVTPISDLEYTVIIEYGDGTVASSSLLLIHSGNAFLIDFIETHLIE